VVYDTTRNADLREIMVLEVNHYLKNVIIIELQSSNNKPFPVITFLLRRLLRIGLHIRVVTVKITRFIVKMQPEV